MLLIGVVVANCLSGQCVLKWEKWTRSSWSEETLQTSSVCSNQIAELIACSCNLQPNCSHFISRTRKLVGAPVLPYDQKGIMVYIPLKSWEALFTMLLQLVDSSLMSDFRYIGWLVHSLKWSLVCLNILFSKSKVTLSGPVCFCFRRPFMLSWSVRANLFVLLITRGNENWNTTTFWRIFMGAADVCRSLSLSPTRTHKQTHATLSCSVHALFLVFPQQIRSHVSLCRLMNRLKCTSPYFSISSLSLSYKCACGSLAGMWAASAFVLLSLRMHVFFDASRIKSSTIFRLIKLWFWWVLLKTWRSPFS